MRSQEVFYCTTIFTKQFDVYSAKKFPGMQSTSLIWYLPQVASWC